MVLMADQGPSSAVIEGIMRCREIDTAVRAVVGPSGCHESSFREGMGAYICDLRRSTGPLLWMGSQALKRGLATHRDRLSAGVLSPSVGVRVSASAVRPMRRDTERRGMAPERWS